MMRAAPVRPAGFATFAATGRPARTGRGRRLPAVFSGKA